jgi:hypothetical protein
MMRAHNSIGPNKDTAATVALQALGFIMGDASLRERFIDLSGVTPDDLRHELDTESVLAAVLGFLASHEPDLLACAAALDLTPAQLMNAAYVLQGGHE